MTTLLLSGADALVGAAVGTLGQVAGSAVTSLFAGGAAVRDKVRVSEGPRLSEMPGLASTEGAAIPRLYGRARIGGQLVWATRFEEVVNTTSTVERQPSRGGKSLGGKAKATTTTTLTTTYSYFVSLAVGLCEGPVAAVRRVWADGQEVDLTTLTMRVYPGDEVQAPDPLIVAKEGSAPAYRGLAYVVFERLALAPFGNRVPQFSFEVIRPANALGPMIRSVCLIPGATEFGYDTVPVLRNLGLGASAPENIHQLQRPTDLSASLDNLQALCPNLRHVSLVTSWFGDDLRAGACTIAPRVDLSAKDTVGAAWSVAGLDRVAAREASRAGGVAAYGGTPADASVVRAIAELKGRGLAVTLYPFVMMDVAAGNALPDPHTGAASQPAYPWRGRITCDPAPERASTVDGTAAAATQVAAFFGSAVPANFAIADGRVVYSGPDEWSLRRLVLHSAYLAVLAGGVQGFVIGSELLGLTRVRSGPGLYPAVARLRTLAADVRSVLGAGTKLVYAADWTEYGAHVLNGGSEVRFPLDPLWADPNIDAVGIDYYPPISDWRDEPAHADLALATSIYDRNYLRGRLGAGEAFDWYYANDAARLVQARSPITDGAYGKTWIFRPKDLVGWWSNPHVERVGGVETGPTAWSPGGKPIWLTEIGIPAVDKGPNGPNVFPDPKSAESAVPPLSTGGRDDLVQSRALEAILSRFDPGLPGHETAMNPAAPAYGGRMVDEGRVSVWCWDARPFPAFPDFASVWADGANWWAGHWVTGRLEGAPLDRLVASILTDAGLDPGDTSPLEGFLDGYVIDRPMSCREALEPLADLFGFDAAAVAGAILWGSRGGRVVATIASSDMAASGDDPILSRSRAQETDLPGALELAFTDGEGGYARAAVRSHRLAGTSQRELSRDVAAVTRRDEAQRLAEIALQDLWAGRETVSFSLSPRQVALAPGDVVDLGASGAPALHRIERIVDGAVRRVQARAVEPAIFGPSPPSRPVQDRTSPPPLVPGQPFCLALDLPAGGLRPEPLQYLAVAADPWPGAVAIWRSLDGLSFDLLAVSDLPALVGRTLGAFPAGPAWRWDRISTLDVALSGAGGLTTIIEAAALEGGNLFAILGTDGIAEVFSARAADLVAARTYRLSGFLRGLGGTEAAAARSVPAGAILVRLDEALVSLTSSLGDLGRACTYRIGPASRDHADPSYVRLDATVGPLALRPLSPVRIRAARNASGVQLAWIRRTRLDGDSWDLAEVPLGEEVEAYEVDILASSGTVLRTLSASTPAVLYGAADEIADFGGAQASLSVRVCELSRTVGRGSAAGGTILVS